MRTRFDTSPSRLGILAIFLLSSSFFFRQAFAQTWQTFLQPQGLADNSLADLFVDTEGVIWFATLNGISRFDGQWSTFQKENGLASNLVFAIAQDADGDVWFGTYGGGINRIDPANDLNDHANWTTYNSANTGGGLAQDTVLNILVARDGKIWFSTKSGGLSVANPTPDPNNPTLDPLFDSKNWMTFTTEDGLSANGVRALLEDEVGNIWVNNAEAVDILVRDTRQWYPFVLPNEARKNTTSLFMDQTGDIWIGTNGLGVFYVPLGQLLTYEKQFTESNGLASNSVSAIAQDQEGVMWFGTNKGASAVQPGSGMQDSVNWKTFTIAEGLGHNSISNIIEDNEGNLWFAHWIEQGVSRLDRTWLSFLTQNNKGQTNFINGLFCEEQRALWIATNGGAIRTNLDSNFMFQKSVSEIFNSSNSGMRSSERVLFIFPDSRSHIWFVTDRGTYRVPRDQLHDENQWIEFTPVSGLASFSIYGLVEDRFGYIWVATDRGLNRVHVDSTLDARNWKTITISHGLPSNHIFALLKDHSGLLWLGTDQGLSFFDPALNPFEAANWKNYDTRQGLINNNIETIYEDEAGNLWFGTEGGVSAVNPDELNNPNGWKNYSRRNGLINDWVIAVTQTKANEFWFGTSAGASRLELNGQSEKWTSYSINDGLRSNFITTLLTDPQTQNVYLGTKGGGVTRYHPKTRAPETILLSHFSIVSENSITFQFTGGDMRNSASELRYLYRLDHQPWSYSSGESVTLFVENSDRPERHVFEVKAVDRDGNIDGSPASEVFYKIDARFGGKTEFDLTVDSTVIIRLYAPPGMLLGDKGINISVIKNYLLNDPHTIVAFELSPHPENFAFTKPGRLAVSYLPWQPFNASEIALFRQSDLAEWTGVGGTVSLHGDTLMLVAGITAFGRYAVRSEKVLPDPAFALDEINLQPRIFSPNGGGRGYGDRVNILFKLVKEAEVTIKIYNMAGRLARKLFENVLFSAGRNAVEWNGRDEDGSVCVSGLYIVTIAALGKFETRTLVVMNVY